MTLSLLEGAAHWGLPRDALARAAGVDLGLVTSPDARLSVETDASFWRAASRLLGDSALALKLAESSLSSSSFGALGFLAMTSATVGEALGRVAQFNRILREDVDKRLVATDEMMVVEEVGAGPPDVDGCSRSTAPLRRSSSRVDGRGRT